MVREEIENGIKDLEPWFHFMLLDGVPTKGKAISGEGLNYPSQLFSPISKFFTKEFFEKKRCLDIGCNSGFFSFEMARLGADVLGVDNDQWHKAIGQAEFANKVFGLEDVDFKRCDFMDMECDQEFDVVLFLGVYYHLQEPEKALAKIASMMKQGGVLFLETAYGVEPERYGDTGKVYNSDPTNFLVPSKDGINREIVEAGFDITEVLQYNRHFVKAVKR